jgi:hypothetical protein
MAAWQYEILMLPKAALAKVFHDIPTRLDNHGSEEFDWWNQESPLSDYAEALDRLLPGLKSWSQEIQIWGVQDKNRVQIVRQQEYVVEMSAFIDVRDLDMNFVEGLVGFAEQYKLMLLMDDMTLLEPNLYKLLLKIKGSAVMQFVKNPEGFIELLRQVDIQRS